MRSDAEQEIKVAYNSVIDLSMALLRNGPAVPGVSPEEAVRCYREAFNQYRRENYTKAERLAKAATHLAYAFMHEGKADYLLTHETDLPFLMGTREEYYFRETPSTLGDLLLSLELHPPHGYETMPEDMAFYLRHGRDLLARVEEEKAAHPNELLKVEWLRAIYEYARTVECLALAYEKSEAVDATSAA